MTLVDFYFDLGSPYAYLAAERLDDLFPPVDVHWHPVLLGALFKLTGRSSWALDDDDQRRQGMAEIERRSLSYGLPPVRWPDRWPTDYLTAMRAATAAFRLGRGREFARQAYRDAFQTGADLSLPAHVLEAGSEAGLDPGKLEAASHDPGVKAQLRQATQAAFERGVMGVPTLAIDGELFWGDDRLAEAAAYLAR